MIRRTVPLVVVLLLALVAVPAWADAAVQTSLTPEQHELTVGDTVLLHLEVTHPGGYQVIIPQLGQMWGDFEVRSQSGATTTANDDGTATTRQAIEVTLFNVGEFQTPKLPLSVSDGTGQLYEEIVPSVSLAVVPTLSEDDNELRVIKPQAGLAVPAAWPWIAGGTLLAAAIAVVGWWAYRRWRGEPLFAPAEDRRPPWQVALDELARIEGLGLLEQGRFKEYYTLVTDAQRTYLEKQFGLDVFERTTSELRPILRRSSLAAEHSQRFLDLFGESDLVKFAKFTPDIEMGHRALVEARALVEMTQPPADAELEQFLASGQATNERQTPAAPMASAA